MTVLISSVRFARDAFERERERNDGERGVAGVGVVFRDYRKEE